MKPQTSPRPSKCLALCAMALALQAAAASAHAQIVIGQTAAFNGPDGSYVREARLGATLYFDAVNEQGGIHGQKIELVSIDDDADPQRAAANVRTLLQGWQAMALFLPHGTATSQAAAAAIGAQPAALIGPSSGAHALRQPLQPYVFNVRASYRRELQQALQGMNRLGLTRFVVIQSGDAFGDDAAVGITDAAIPVKPLLTERFDPAHPGFDGIAERVARLDPHVVFMIADTAAAVAGIQAVRAAGSRAQVLTLSNNATNRFIDALGPLARGVAVTQVFPYERSMVSPLVKRAMDVARTRGVHGLSQPLMEGFAAAQVLIEGLRRAGPKPDRDKLITALNSIQRLNIGGMMIDYSSRDHTGSNYTDTSVISGLGRFQR